MLVVYGIVEGLYLMSIVAFLFAGVYLLMENNSSPVLHVDVTERGIQVGGSFYDYSQFSRFAMVSRDHVPAFVRLYPVRKLSPLIDIPLSTEISSTELRSYLATVMEEEYNNSISNADALIHAMKL
jgi:hypothetical protein